MGGWLAKKEVRMILLAHFDAFDIIFLLGCIAMITILALSYKDDWGDWFD